MNNLIPNNLDVLNIACHVISVDPIIIVGMGCPGPLYPAMALSPQLEDKKVYYFIGKWNSLQDKNEFIKTVYYYNYLVNKYKNHYITFMVNENADKIILDSLNIPAVLCHHNTFIDEKIFKIKKEKTKKYDAIYNACMASFKRHTLASALKNVAFIYYNWQGEKGNIYKRNIKRIMKNAVFLNDSFKGRGYQYFSPSEVCDYYNEAKVGLCLSASEGGMYASIEYLLSGLPVVSTPNRGGRNFFFDDKYCRIVAPDPDKIREAVAEISSNCPDGEYIRNMTILRMIKQRHFFIKLIQNIYDKENVGRRFVDEWDTIFINKMVYQSISVNVVLNYIREHTGNKGAITKKLKPMPK